MNIVNTLFNSLPCQIFGKEKGEGEIEGEGEGGEESIEKARMLEA